MDRRSVIAGIAAAGASLASAGCASLPAGTARLRPGDAGWPTDAEWAGLKKAVGGRLEKVSVPSPSPEEAKKLFANPIWLGDQVGLTESSGWVGAWTSAPSAYAVRAKSAADVAEAVRFASARRLRLVVKGGGHSYHGGSCAPDSLLVWMRDLETIEMHDAFTPNGCAAAPVPAVTVGAGCIWGRVYDTVTTKGGRYVQGGGCTTVGVAGLVLGGGFGSFSKGFGLAAASLLEAEIVTADGRVRVVNACRDPDLFWALKGGGGGTFGVVTRMTLRTHDLPQIIGAVRLTIKATSDDAFKRLLVRFIETYAANLHTPHWGEQIRTMTDNRLVCEMSFQGIGASEARAAWADFVAFAEAAPADYQIIQPLQVLPLPAQHFWDKAFFDANAPDAIKGDDRPGARPRDYWWAGDGAQASAVWLGYASAWLPASLLRGDGKAALADAWFNASRQWTVSFHFNKGLAGASAATLAASRDTSINPQVLDAFALAIIAAGGPSIYPQLPPPNLSSAERAATHIGAAMQALKKVAPDAGSYLSESDFFKQRWQEESWGPYWPRLSQIKRRYDPDGLFIVHHGVGSEAWSADGFARAKV